MNVEMAKLAFAKGIWTYVCKMDRALRQYSSSYPRNSCSVLAMRRLIKKVLQFFNPLFDFSLSLCLFGLFWGEGSGSIFLVHDLILSSYRNFGFSSFVMLVCTFRGQFGKCVYPVQLFCFAYL